LPKRDHRDLAALLLRKASGDEAALGALGHESAVPDDIVGFHAQQAVEKLMKAALAALDRDFPRTHDLGLLQTLLEDAGEPLPDRLLALEELTVWSAQFRYEDVPDARLDRPATLELVMAVREWAIEIVERPRVD
jgi:HEPN domain-containing protein